MSIINSFLDTMASLASQSGFAGFLVDGGWKNHNDTYFIRIYVSGYCKGL